METCTIIVDTTTVVKASFSGASEDTLAVSVFYQHRKRAIYTERHNIQNHVDGCELHGDLIIR